MKNFDPRADGLFASLECLLKKHRDYLLAESEDFPRLADLAAVDGRIEVPTRRHEGLSEPETLNRWIDGRTKRALANLNPLMPKDATTACELIFFHAYYVQAVPTRGEICNDDPGKAKRYGSISALQRDWEVLTGKRLSNLAAPALTAREQRTIDVLLPMSERSVTNYVRRGLATLFQLQCAKSVARGTTRQLEPPAIPPNPVPWLNPHPRPPTAASNGAAATADAPPIQIHPEASETTRTGVSVLERLPAEDYALFTQLAELPYLWTWSPRSAAFLSGINDKNARRMVKRMLAEGLVSELPGRHGEKEYRVVDEWHCGPDEPSPEHQALLDSLRHMPSDRVSGIGDYFARRDYPDEATMVCGRPAELEVWTESRVTGLGRGVSVRQGYRPTNASHWATFIGAEQLVWRWAHFQKILDWLQSLERCLWLDLVPVLAELEGRVVLWRRIAAGLLIATMAAMVLLFLCELRGAIGWVWYLVVGVALLVGMSFLVSGGVYAKLRSSWVRVLWEFGITPRGINADVG